jgi:hypothetical protein
MVMNSGRGPEGPGQAPIIGYVVIVFQGRLNPCLGFLDKFFSSLLS